MTKNTSLTCPCRQGAHNISQDGVKLTDEFIAIKMDDIQEVYEQLNMIQCTAESGNRICDSSIDRVQSVLDKIEALCTDYQDQFKSEIPALKR